MPPRRRCGRRILPLLVVLATAAAMATSCGGDEASGSFRGSRIEPLDDVTGPTLPDVSADGEDFTFRADEGEVLLVYFGYTSCPDVCPTTLADLRTGLRQLDQADAGRVDMAMVTVDPGRDTDEILTGYIQSFVDGAHALRTEDNGRLTEAAEAFGAAYGAAMNEDGELEVFHSGFLYAVDDQGRLQVTWPFGAPPEDFSHDIELLLDTAA